ncbi:hypothetical protein RA2_04054 [Roseovarius sp. A-2]|uniref:hypothetical protein n=1 Tax=Roseovarius sp. A-2 TaxID=1570360 RepID=UPI0009B52078|nr:hypothetical protein [Roseovarius sp. A-2]GAW36979.1 hypothetical protein RA2_04054 [Roseovarius sp. A-2]
MNMNVNFPTASDFLDAQTPEEFDAARDQYLEAFADEFEDNEAYEAAGGDSAADDSADSFIAAIGAYRPREVA